MTIYDARLTIGAAAAAVNRKPHTLREWERRDMLPNHLRPHRNDRGHRYYTEAQIEGIKRWLVEADIRQGKGLPTTGHRRLQFANEPAEEGVTDR